MGTQGIAFRSEAHLVPDQSTSSAPQRHPLASRGGAHEPFPHRSHPVFFITCLPTLRGTKDVRQVLSVSSSTPSKSRGESTKMLSDSAREQIISVKLEKQARPYGPREGLRFIPKLTGATYLISVTIWLQQENTWSLSCPADQRASIPQGPSQSDYCTRPERPWYSTLLPTMRPLHST